MCVYMIFQYLLYRNYSGKVTLKSFSSYRKTIRLYRLPLVWLHGTNLAQYYHRFICHMHQTEGHIKILAKAEDNVMSPDHHVVQVLFMLHSRADPCLGASRSCEAPGG